MNFLQKFKFLDHARSTSMNDMATYGITHYNSYFSSSIANPTTKNLMAKTNNIDESIKENNCLNSSSINGNLKLLFKELNKTFKIKHLFRTNIIVLVDNRISRTSFGSDTNIGPLDERVILSALESGCLESVLRLMVCGFNINNKIGSTYALHVAVNFVRFFSF